MPYSKASELPDSVKHVLSIHAQHIYMKAFNSAFDEYKESSSRKGNKTREETAFSVAWSAVKKKYRKTSDGKWHEK
jgi:cation transport regulator